MLVQWPFQKVGVPAELGHLGKDVRFFRRVVMVHHRDPALHEGEEIPDVFRPVALLCRAGYIRRLQQDGIESSNYCVVGMRHAGCSPDVEVARGSLNMCQSTKLTDGRLGSSDWRDARSGQVALRAL